MNIAIIDYNAGNIRSVDFALQRLGVNSEITADYEKISNADRVIFPGVGEASTTMAFLKDKKLDVLIKSLKQPVLGICLGLQLMCKHSEEGNTECFGIFDENIKKFDNSLDNNSSNHYKIPQMGWNTITGVCLPLLNSSQEGKYVYFVHSYYAEIGKHTIATSNYIVDFSAALRKDNFFATQFHPEKSGDVGSKILENFIKLNL